jgi:asparagine synthase (glutamine-hydrolysing)
LTTLAGAFESTPAGARLTYTSGSARCVVLGYLTNVDEPVEASVWARYASEGPDAIARLRGSFVIGVWDDDARRGVLATDHLGTGGLFYRTDGRRLVFASEIATLLDLLDSTPSPDEDALIRWLAYEPTAGGQTLYAGVRRLRGGELIELGTEGYRVRTYWKPRYVEPPTRTAAEHADADREATAAAVRSRVSSNGRTGLLLSGGLDSSSIAAFTGSGIRAYSAVFPDHPEIDESRLIRDVTSTLELPLTTLDVRGGSMLPASLDYLARWRLPSVSPTLVFMSPLARAAGDDGIEVLLDGEGGDELFSGSPFVFTDLLLHGRIRSALSIAERLPGTAGRPRQQILSGVLRQWALRGAVPYAVHAGLRRLRPAHYGARWLTPSTAAHDGRHADEWEWKLLDGPRWWADLAYDFTQGRERMGAHDFLRHKSADAGLQGRHPYFDDLDLVEQMLAIPSELAFDSAYDRPLLRRATAGLLPDTIRLRRDKSYFNPLVDQTLMSTDRSALLSLFRAGALVGRYVRTDVLSDYVTGCELRPASWTWVVWRAAAAECWLRTLQDPSFPARALEEWQPAAPRLEFNRNDVYSLPA